MCVCVFVKQVYLFYLLNCNVVVLFSFIDSIVFNDSTSFAVERLADHADLATTCHLLHAGGRKRLDTRQQ